MISDRDILTRREQTPGHAGNPSNSKSSTTPPRLVHEVSEYIFQILSSNATKNVNGELQQNTHKNHQGVWTMDR